ncbi:MAG: hypothetical protein JSS02_22675 [Planctomycetes bacterium]|nr:hypothetical protein [Planctomycetota bacterium]
MNDRRVPDLSYLHDALDVVCEFLDRSGFPYAIAGGMAVAIWGEPRATYDVDLVVAANFSAPEDLLAAIRAEPAFFLDPQTLPMPPDMNIIRAHLVDKQASEPGIILVDLLLLKSAFAASLQQRRILMTVAGRERWVCSVEDLIVLKLMSGRTKDLEDVRGIRRIQEGAINVEYVADWAERLNCQANWQIACAGPVVE